MHPWLGKTTEPTLILVHQQPILSAGSPGFDLVSLVD
jgi:hypothetical protein